MKAPATILACLLSLGCLSAPQAPTGSPGAGLPTHPWTDAATALETMAARDLRLTSVRLVGTLKLEESADRSVLLEAILVLQSPPGQAPRLRLQAKKLGHTAFDLTLNDQGTWLVDGREKTEGAPAGQGLAQMGKGLRQLCGGQVWRRAHVIAEQADTFRVRLDDQGRATATLHKATLVPLGFDFTSPQGPVRLRLEYAPVTAGDGDVFPLPCKLAASAPQGRRFAFEARRLEANPVLPAAVFTPPKSAVLLKAPR